VWTQKKQGLVSSVSKKETFVSTRGREKTPITVIGIRGMNKGPYLGGGGPFHGSYLRLREKGEKIVERRGGGGFPAYGRRSYSRTAAGGGRVA